MSANSQATCWVVTDGKAGMENQCVGLAEALGLTPVVKRIVLRSPWKQLSPFLRHGLGCAFSDKGDPVVPPWPDLLIATGRASVPAALHARRMSAKEGKRTFTVQIQNPVIDASRFDLVVVPRHDGLSGANVMTTRGSLHRITPQILADAAAEHAPVMASVPQPRVAVLIGGNNAVYILAPREMKVIAGQLAALAKKYGLMVTPSRRTGEENIKILQDALQGTSAYVWDWNGPEPNPYYGMLGLADYIIATCDSIGMVTEACSTGKPVMIIDLPGGSDKFRRFHQATRDDGMTRPFKGAIENWSYAPLDDMRLIAERVRQMMSLK
jgi:mitochondrial fission protein ELM1